MLKKTALLVCVAFFVLTLPIQAQLIDMKAFDRDFNTLLTGVARDVAPSLPMGALSAEVVGDATIDHFNFTVPGVAISATTGIARVLKPGAAKWDFVVPMADLINTNLQNDADFFQSLFFYPAIKLGLGMNVGGGWDVQVSGIYFPQALTNMAVSSFVPASAKKTVEGLKPQFSFGNLGLKARRTIIEDSGLLGIVPAISVGTGYTYSYFDLGVQLRSLTDLGSAPIDLSGTKLDMSGRFGVKTASHNATIDLQISKHVLILTPFVKLTGAYQNSTFQGNADMVATTTSGTTTESQAIVSKPEVSLSRFTFLTTTGMEINLVYFAINVNAVADLGRAFLKVNDFTLKGVEADAFSLNAGFRFMF